jgi:hypothetical protein
LEFEIPECVTNGLLYKQTKVWAHLARDYANKS